MRRFAILWFAMQRLAVLRFTVRWFAVRRLAILWFAMRLTGLLRSACVLLPAFLLWAPGRLRTGLFARMRVSQSLLWDFPRPQLLLRLLPLLRSEFRAGLRTHVQSGLRSCVWSLLRLNLRDACLRRLRAGLRLPGRVESLRRCRGLCAADFRATFAVPLFQQQGRPAADCRTGRDVSRRPTHADPETVRPSVGRQGEGIRAPATRFARCGVGPRQHAGVR